MKRIWLGGILLAAIVPTSVAGQVQTTFQYDALGRLTTANRVGNSITQYGYDTADNRASVVVQTQSAPTCEFSVQDTAIPKFGGSPMSFNIKKVGVCGNVTLTYSTADGTAKSGSSYAPTSGSVTFQPSDSSKFVDIPTYYNYPTNNEEIGFYLNISISSGFGKIARSQAFGYFYDAS